MNKARTPFLILITVLLGIGILLCLYRYWVLDIPLIPGEKKAIWTLEAKVEFVASGDPVMVHLAIPDTQQNFERIAEHSASPGYGLTYTGAKHSRKAEWSIREAYGKQTLYYRVDMLAQDQIGQTDTVSIPDISNRGVRGSGPQVTEAKAILQQAEQRSADSYTLARELLKELGKRPQSVQLLAQRQSVVQWVVDMLATANVASREVHALRLEDGRRRQKLRAYLQVFNVDSYQLFDVETGTEVSSDKLLLWEYNSGALLELVGGKGAVVLFSILKQEIAVNQLDTKKTEKEALLLDFSIHSLPLEEQTLFKGILLIPVGVLVVVFLRLFVGIVTSGTFMPVLIAIAFIQTSLVTGLIGFVLIVGMGLVIRSFLSQHNLLLVARISVVIITVIILISIFTVVAYRSGLTEGLKITFFPMIILGWTIERMSILWEEEGPKEVLVQTSGSLFVAVIAYLLMQNAYVQHLTFNFIGLQFILMALLLVMGSYTGYRLFELRRFRPLSSKI